MLSTLLLSVNPERLELLLEDGLDPLDGRREVTLHVRKVTNAARDAGDGPLRKAGKQEMNLDEINKSYRIRR